MKKQVVFITGCSSGIGLALATEFTRRGFTVVGTVRQPKQAERLKAQGIFPQIMDVTDAEQVSAAIDQTLSEHGGIDVLINNAGYGLIGPLVEVPHEELVRQFETNVFAPMVLIRKVTSIMKERGSGMIVNIGSVSGVVTTPFAGAYCATKAALHALSDALRMELAPFGIKVVTVQPGAVQSQFGARAKQIVEKILRSDSWYAPIESKLLARADASQVKAMPAETFAQKVVSQLIEKNPPPVIRLAPKSKLLPFLKSVFSVSRLDQIFSKKFGLKELHTRKKEQVN